MSGPRLLTAKQAAERCGLRDPETIKAWARRAGYNMPRFGRGRYTLLFPEELIDELIAKRTPQIPNITVRPRRTARTTTEILLRRLTDQDDKRMDRVV